MPNPLPWRWERREGTDEERGVRLVDANGEPVLWGYADTDYDSDIPCAVGGDDEAKERVVRAVNGRDDLLAMVREMADLIEEGAELPGEPPIVTKARALLAREMEPACGAPLKLPDGETTACTARAGHGDDVDHTDGRYSWRRLTEVFYACGLRHSEDGPECELRRGHAEPPQK